MSTEDIHIILHKLPYFVDSANWFERIRHLPLPVFLDSGYPIAQSGRYDIISADPSHIFETTIQGECFLYNGKSKQLLQSDCPISTLNKFIQQQLTQSKKLYNRELADCLPFNGGAIGYFSYELGNLQEKIADQREIDIPLPLIHVGIYQWAIITDHNTQQCWFVSQPDSTMTIERIQSFTVPKAPTDFMLLDDFSSNMTEQQYYQKFHKIIEYILAGDCYQVNLAQRFSAPYEGDCWQAYGCLRQAYPGPFSVYMETSATTILSMSPERFLQLEHRQVTTQPIKGTRPRSANAIADKQYADELRHSSKDQAENLMIVDLLRNDLGRVCVPGSIKVKQLFQLSSFANVHHLVSTICGTLKNEMQALDLLNVCFPGGSITGAPKIRSMEIIAELEPQQRSVYCGSIGYLSFNGKMDSNIAIRSFISDHKKLYCWGGGGIVAESDAQQEYQESLSKIRHLMQALC